jgi:predicted transcriptional regulator of viral defense system
VAPQPYLITGGAALEHHDLTDQHFYSFAVLTPSRVTPIQYRTERAVFLPTEPKYIWGGKGRPHFATSDRVLLDVLNSPRYSVPFSVAVSALNLAIRREQKFLRRLLASARRFQSDAAARRVGLLVEELAGPELAAPFRELIGGSRTPVLLRRGGQTEGPVNSAWRVIVNASIELEAAGSK